MKLKSAHQLLTFLIAAVWFINGLVCKVLDLVPRHQQIVARISGEASAPVFTTLIGVSEMIMAAWIWSGKWPRLNAIIQIVVIATMNMIEFFMAPDLLLWGKMNSVFALLFILLIYYNEFYLNRKLITG
jgi:hypothetical protein